MVSDLPCSSPTNPLLKALLLVTNTPALPVRTWEELRIETSPPTI